MEQIFSKLQEEIGDQVDFELPDWINKWKPTYKFIRKSILCDSCSFAYLYHITCECV